MRVALLLTLLAAAPQDLSTVSEKSGFTKTGRYDETVTLVKRFAEAFPGQAQWSSYGTTPQGRPLLALAVSADGKLDPKSAAAANRPVILFQGGIHAGEIDGKDAGFLLLRELLTKPEGRALLNKVTVVFVPVVNPDGHERFGKNNRPNQRGPEEMGFRVTSQNLNLNRDYVKDDAPEMDALLRLLQTWDPIVYVDLHVTDGAKFQHDIALVLEPRNAGPEKLRQQGAALSKALMSMLERQGHLPLPFYPEFEKHDDPTSGIADTVAPPRFQKEYWMWRNRIGVLVETHSWKPYKARVLATRDAMQDVLELTAKDGAAWRASAKEADEEATHLGGTEVPLAYEASEKSTTIPYKGYVYVREPSGISGKLWTRYDETKPETWQIPFRGEIRVKLKATAPKAGYVVSAGWAEVVKKRLDAHGLRYSVLKGAQPVEAEVFRATEAKLKDSSYEGHQPVQLKGAWAKEKQSTSTGDLFVPIDQPGARLVVQLFEPAAPDSLAAWGFFNAAFERKEYMEDYVTEEVARQMLAKDPKLAAEFAKKLETEPEFAKSPEARLEFFYRRHPAWDERYMLLPVMKVDAAP